MTSAINVQRAFAATSFIGHSSQLSARSPLASPGDTFEWGSSHEPAGIGRSQLLNLCYGRPAPAPSEDAKMLAFGDEPTTQEALAHTFESFAPEIEDVAQRVGIPRAALTALLARERMNDQKAHGSMDSYQWEDALGVATSAGPAGVSGTAFEEMFRLSPQLFEGKRETMLAECNALFSHSNDSSSVYWGAQYLKSIHDVALKQDALKGDQRWAKAIGLYNEGLGERDHYNYGPYSRSAETLVKAARAEWQKRDSR